MLSTLRLPLHGVCSFHPLTPAARLVLLRPASTLSSIHNGLRRSGTVEKKKSSRAVPLSWRSVKDLEAEKSKDKRNRDRDRVYLEPGERKPVTRAGRFHNPKYPDGKSSLKYALLHNEKKVWDAVDGIIAEKKSKPGWGDKPGQKGDSDQFGKAPFSTGAFSSLMRQPGKRDDAGDGFASRFKQNTASSAREFRRREDGEGQNGAPWARPQRGRDDAQGSFKDRFAQKNTPPGRSFGRRDDDRGSFKDGFTQNDARSGRWFSKGRDDQGSLRDRFTQKDTPPGRSFGRRDDDKGSFKDRFTQKDAPPGRSSISMKDRLTRTDTPPARESRWPDDDEDGLKSRFTRADDSVRPSRRDDKVKDNYKPYFTPKDASPVRPSRRDDIIKDDYKPYFTPKDTSPVRPSRRDDIIKDDYKPYFTPKDTSPVRPSRRDDIIKDNNKPYFTPKDTSLVRQSRRDGNAKDDYKPHFTPPVRQPRKDDDNDAGSPLKQNDAFPPRQSRGRHEDQDQNQDQDWEPSSFARDNDGAQMQIHESREDYAGERSAAREEDGDVDEPPRVRRSRDDMGEGSYFPAQGGRETGAARRVRESEERRAAASRDGDGSSRPRKWNESGRNDVDFSSPISIEYTTAGSQFIYGRSAVKSALRIRRRKIYRLYVYQAENRRPNPTDDILISEATRHNISVKIISDQRIMDKMSQGRPHNGYVLEASTLPNPPVIALSTVYDGNDPENIQPSRGAKKPKHGFHVLMGSQTKEDLAINGSSSFIPTATSPAKAKQPSLRPLVLLLDGVLDPENLGALLRSAAFLGVSAVGITSYASSTLGPTALKAAAGAAEEIPLFSVRIPATDFLRASRNAGWHVYAAVAPPSHALLRSVIKGQFQSLTEVEQSQPLNDAPCVVVLGNEGFGLTVDVKRTANVELYIPRGTSSFSLVDSLNVSVAGALICGAFLKRLGTKPAAKKGVAQTDGASTVEPEDEDGETLEIDDEDEDDEGFVNDDVATGDRLF